MLLDLNCCTVSSLSSQHNANPLTDDTEFKRNVLGKVRKYKIRLIHKNSCFVFSCMSAWRALASVLAIVMENNLFHGCKCD